MGKNSAIEWTDHTWNPWYGGCEPRGPECLNCYARRDMKRYGKEPDKLTFGKTVWNAPTKWRKPARVFVCSWSDFFLTDVLPSWRRDAWGMMRAAPHHTYMIPTKRPHNIRRMLPSDWGKGWPNVWLLVSCGTVRTFHRWWPILRDIPAVVKGVSMEPLLEDVADTLRYHSLAGRWLESDAPQWVIVGCESLSMTKPGRPTELDWVRRVVDICDGHIPLFIKQLDMGDGKITRMPVLDGREWNEYPEV